MAKLSKKLASVARRSKRDPEFFRALLKDQRKTLKAANIELSKTDKARLRALIRDADGARKRFTKKIDGLRAQRLLTNRRINASGEDWPEPGWAYMWRRFTFLPDGRAEIEFEKDFGI